MINLVKACGCYCMPLSASVAWTISIPLGLKPVLDPGSYYCIKQNTFG